MLANLTSGLDFQSKALVLRAERQRAIASNIANADTPGYVARDFDFKAAMADANTAVGRQVELSSPNHPAHIAIPGNLSDSAASRAQLGYTVQTQPSMDGNSVDLDRERANFADNAVRYEATLRFINGQSKTILSAIQGQ